MVVIYDSYHSDTTFLRQQCSPCRVSDARLQYSYDLFRYEPVYHCLFYSRNHDKYGAQHTARTHVESQNRRDRQNLPSNVYLLFIVQV